MNPTIEEAIEEDLLIDGVLTELHVEFGRQNLLEKIDRHYRSSSLVAGAAAAAGAMFGQLANAAALAMYDGEDTQNFACLIGDKVVYGQFGGAEFLKAGNRVKAVVSKRGDVLLAEAIMDASQGYLWIAHPWGQRAEMISNWKLASWCIVWGLAFITVCAKFMGTGIWTFGETMARAGGGLVLMCVVVALWSTRDMARLAQPSTRMFGLLGFSDPAGVNLNRYRVSIAYPRHGGPTPSGARHITLGMAQTRDVYCYKLAIEDGRAKLA